MIQNLETADRITKLVLAISIVILYLSKAIAGPFANVLLILSALVILIFVAKLIITLVTTD